MTLPIKLVVTIQNPKPDDAAGRPSNLRLTFSESYGSPGEVATLNDIRLRVAPGRGLYGADPSTRVWSDVVTDKPVPASVSIPDGGAPVAWNGQWIPPYDGDVLLGVFSGPTLIASLTLKVAAMAQADVYAALHIIGLPQRDVRPPANPPARLSVVSNSVPVRFGNNGGAASNPGVGIVYARRGGKNAAGVVDGWVSFIDAGWIEVGRVNVPGLPKGAEVTLNVPVTGFVTNRGGVMLKAAAEVPGAGRVNGNEAQVLE